MRAALSRVKGAQACAVRLSVRMPPLAMATCIAPGQPACIGADGAPTEATAGHTGQNGVHAADKKAVRGDAHTSCAPLLPCITLKPPGLAAPKACTSSLPEASWAFAACQEFMAVFRSLRSELVDDPLLDGQPQFAKDWLLKV